MGRKADELDNLVFEILRDTNRYRLRRQRYWDVDLPVQPQHIIPLKRFLEETKGLKEEFEKIRTQLVRARADLENMRKRHQKERQEITLRANELLFLNILNVLDNFELGIKSAENLSESDKTFFEGIEMTYHELKRILSEHGLNVIDALGKPFDPLYHEAISTEHVEDKPDNIILSVLRDGYMFHGKLIRPAMVTVNKKE